MLRPQNVLIDNGRISRIWTGYVEVLPGTRVIEAEDKFVMPGLTDCHTHLFPDCFGLFLSHGITCVRDMASISDWTIKQRQEIEDQNVVGPSIFTHGELIDGPTSRRLNEPHTICVAGEDEIAFAVHALAQKGVDAIKLYSELPFTVFTRGVHEAHEAGLTVSAHVGHSRMVTVKQAIAAGVDAIEHAATFLPDMFYQGELAEIVRTLQTPKNQLRGFWAWAKLDLSSPLVSNIIASLVERHIYHTPTLVNVETLIEGESLLGNEERGLLNAIPGAIREKWPLITPSLQENWTKEEINVARQGFENIKQLTGMMYKAGVNLGVGSDAPNPWTIPGPGLLREMELLVECGIPSIKVIQFATKNAADIMGKRFEDMGSIKEGNMADLVILDLNPADNISNCRKIAGIIRQGKLITADGTDLMHSIS